MPVNSNDPETLLECGISPAAVRELELVAAFIREHADKAASEEDALALVRVVQTISPAVWEQFASAHNLENWLAIPLKGEMAACMSSFFSAFENLAFQRDHDALTGLANRRLFDRRLNMEIERSMRSDSELCLLMLDLDNFKQVNDTYGHACGDEVLKRLGATLASSIRPYDLAARLGGEEFAIIFPSTSCWTGAMLGNRILEKFSLENFLCDGKEFNMTFSAGVSSISLLRGAVTIEKLSTSADQALYTAKRGGKNQVLVAESEKRSRDRASLVQSHEKQLLFSSQSLE